MNFGDLAGNFAGRVRENINQQTPGGLIAKLGEVVAPALDDDDEYEYVTDSEGGSYYEDDEDYEEDDAYLEEANEELEDEADEEEELVFGDDNNDDASTQREILPKSLFTSEPEIENDVQDLIVEVQSHIDTDSKEIEVESMKQDAYQKNVVNVNALSTNKQVGDDLKETVTSIDDDENNEKNPSVEKNLNEFASKTETNGTIGESVNETKYENPDVEPNDEHIESIDQTVQSNETPTQLETETENQLKVLLQGANEKILLLERKLQSSISDQKNISIAQNQKQLRALYLADQKAEEAVKKLSSANIKIRNLSKELDNLNTMVRKQKESADILEKEIKELKEENEMLEDHIQEIEEENEASQEKIEALEEEKNTLRGLQMELHMVKEERERDRTEIQNTVESASSNVNKICSERDEARSQAQTSQQQLEATLADLEIMKNDFERLSLSNGNLQRALEAFQYERDAELELLDEQRKNSDMVQKAANNAKTVALKEENEAKIREVQRAADMAVKNSMREIELLEGSLEQLQKDKKGLRTSLDEAIQRLQMSQEDVIDRTLMKNILLDWHQKRGQGKKQVLELMTSVLHFTEEEKAHVSIGDVSGRLNKVMGAVAAPLPQPALNIDKLEGDNVREKWVNFLLAETGEDVSDEKS